MGFRAYVGFWFHCSPNPKATRKARRDADRRQHLKTSEPPAKPIPPDVDMADPQADNLPPAKPFDQIEEW
uniref:TniA putative transposase n=1 Tax=Pseudomonas aeruginosa TaxID=287 RepID=A0A7S6G5B5_PSEAI|nr:hypothetical protein [Pseudomonas aeruginosa]QNI17607.1 TniA putative transposase [Pseudomonas aeruginosa]